MPPSDAERLITTPSARDALAAALTPHTRLALDTESNSMFAHTERLCLVQLAWGDAADPAVSAIDPLAFGPREAARTNRQMRPSRSNADHGFLKAKPPARGFAKGAKGHPGSGAGPHKPGKPAHKHKRKFKHPS
jgi:hypothetical protein